MDLFKPFKTDTSKKKNTHNEKKTPKKSRPVAGFSESPQNHHLGLDLLKDAESVLRIQEYQQFWRDLVGKTRQHHDFLKLKNDAPCWLKKPKTGKFPL